MWQVKILCLNHMDLRLYTHSEEEWKFLPVKSNPEKFRFQTLLVHNFVVESSFHHLVNECTNKYRNSQSHLFLTQTFHTLYVSTLDSTLKQYFTLILLRLR